MKKIFTLALSIAFIGVFGQAKISDLPATTTLTGVELFPVVQGGVTKKTTAAQIASLSVIFGTSTGWQLSGNSVSTNTAFIGTTSNRSLLFKVNNTQYMKLDSLGNLTTNYNPTASSQVGIRIKNTNATKYGGCLFFNNVYDLSKIEGEGLGSGGALRFYTANNSSVLTNRITLDNDGTSTFFFPSSWRSGTNSEFTVISATTGTSNVNMFDIRTSFTTPRAVIRTIGSYSLSLQTNSIERLGISVGGNVGINKSNPTATLDVAGTGAFSGSVTITGALSSSVIGIGTAPNAAIPLNILGSNAGGQTIQVKNSLISSEAYFTALNSSNQAAQLIMTGVSTTTNALRLNSQMRLYTDQKMLIQTGSGDIVMATGGFGLGNEVLRLTNNNRVGINNSAPTASLDVTGTGAFRSSVSVGGLNLSAGSLSVTSKSINTTSGDAATINSPTGRFRKDTSGATFTLTNSFITANSIIIYSFASDPGATPSHAGWVTAGAGSCTINWDVAPANDTDVNFWIVN